MPGQFAEHARRRTTGYGTLAHKRQQFVLDDVVKLFEHDHFFQPFDERIRRSRRERVRRAHLHEAALRGIRPQKRQGLAHVGGRNAAACNAELCGARRAALRHNRETSLEGEVLDRIECRKRAFAEFVFDGPQAVADLKMAAIRTGGKYHPAPIFLKPAD